jgi:branched-chain amino acid transport system substrate-binding protein
MHMRRIGQHTIGIARALRRIRAAGTRLRFVIVALLLAVGLAAPAAADVRIAVAGPAAGMKAPDAQEIAQGVKRAAERINAQGGVDGEPVTVTEVDDGCAAETAATAARSLIASGVALVIGHPCTSAALAAAKVYAQAGVVFIAPDTRHPALTDARAGSTTFRLSGRDDRQGAAAAAYLSSNFAGQPVTVIRDPSVYAGKLARDALAALKQSGDTKVLTASVRGGQKDYSTLVAKLKKHEVRAVLFTGYPMEGGLLLRKMRQAGLTSIFLGGDALATSQLAAAAGGDADGATALLPHDAARAITDKALLARFAPHPASEPFVSSFAAVEAWAAAARQAKSLKPQEVAGALQQGTFDTVLGALTFDANGDADVPDYDVVSWSDGAWRRKGS